MRQGTIDVHGRPAAAWSVAVRCLAAIAASSSGVVATAAGNEGERCERGWVAGLAGGAPDNWVTDLTVLGSGANARLMARGSFKRIGLASVQWIAIHDGTTWRGVPAVPNGPIGGEAVVHDDGSGPSVILTGSFTQIGGVATNRIVRWDGETYSPIGATPGGGFDNQTTHVVVGPRLLPQDDGGQPLSLFVSGFFTTADGAPAQCIASWDGVSWSSLGVGVSNAPSSLAYGDLGDGPRLFAANVVASGDVPLGRAASWDGREWAMLGEGLNGLVATFLVADLGSGPRLFAGGRFGISGSLPIARVAVFDGRSWSPLGEALPEKVASLVLHDDGRGETLFAATNGALGTDGVHRWTGESWESIGVSDGSVLDLASFDFGDGPMLVAGGNFITLDGEELPRLAAWDGDSWRSVTPSGLDLAGPSLCRSALTVEEGGELITYLLGWTPLPEGSLPVVQRFDGRTISAIDIPYTGYVVDAILFDDGEGDPALIIGGSFTDPKTTVRYSVLRRDGAGWTTLDSVVNAVGDVRALASIDEGDGPTLVAAGNFVTIGGVSALRVARHRAGEWSAMGQGFAAWCEALHVHSGPGGATLYAGQNAVSGPSSVQRWTGVDWVESGPTEFGIGPTVPYDLESHDDGSGLALYVAGQFSSGEGRVARLEPSALGGNWAAAGAFTNRVLRLESHDDGSGGALYAGGNFYIDSGGLVAPIGIARLEGDAWVPLDYGIRGTPNNSVWSGAMGLSSRGDSGLAVAGSFNDVWTDPGAGIVARSFALWGDAAQPTIATHPSSTAVTAGNGAMFSVEALLWPDPAMPIEFQWLRDGREVVDGGGVVGSGSATLTIAAVGIDDAGEYVVRVSSECGSTESQPATLDVSCPGDLDGDGVVGGDDLGLLLRQWGDGEPESDLDGDGVVGASDLALLLAEWGAGC